MAGRIDVRRDRYRWAIAGAVCVEPWQDRFTVAILPAGEHASGPERLMAAFTHRAGRIVRLPVLGYAVAVVGPALITLGLVGFRLPAFVLEHLSLLLVVAAAVRWGIGPAIVAAIVSVFADNVLLRQPFGQSRGTGIHDFTDLGLFAIVAVTIGWLVATVRRERARAELAVQLERRAREDRDQFVATLSHDLVTPLTAISGTVQFAQRFGEAAAVDMPRLLARLGTAAARATSLLRSLQDARALENGGLTPRRSDYRDERPPRVDRVAVASARRTQTYADIRQHPDSGDMRPGGARPVNRGLCASSCVRLRPYAEYFSASSFKRLRWFGTAVAGSADASYSSPM